MPRRPLTPEQRATATYSVPPKGSAGFGQAALQGAVVEAPTSLGGMVDLVRGVGHLAKEGLGRRVLGPALYESEPFEHGTAAAAARRAGKGALASIGRPYKEPRGGMRYLQRAVGGAISSLPMAVSGPGPALARAGLEMASGGLSEVAAQGAEDLGLGAGGQMVAGLAGGVAPALAGTGAARAMGSEVERLVAPARGARRAAQQMVGEQLTAGGPGRWQRAKELLDAEIQTRVMGDPFVPGEATSVQTLAGEFPEIAGLSSTLGREGSRYKGKMSDVIAKNRAALEGTVATKLPRDVAPENVRGRLEAEIEKNQLEEAEAYQQVDEYGVRGSTAPLHRGLAAVEQRMGKAGSGEIPKRQAKTIREDYTQETIDPVTGEKRLEPTKEFLSEIHTFRKMVNNDLERLYADPAGNKYKIANLMRLKEAADAALDRVAQQTDIGAEEVAKLRHAIGLMRQYESVYSGHPAIDAFRSKVDRPEEALAASLRAPDAAAELRNLKTALRGDKEAEEGLKRLFVRRGMLGEKAGDLSQASDWVGRTQLARNYFQKHRKAGEELLGAEGMRSLERFLGRAKQITTENVGTGRQTKMTQSGVATMAQIGLGKKDARGVMMTVVENLRGRYANQLGEILEGALIEPQLMRQLMEKVPPSRFDEWSKRLEKTYRQRFGRSLREGAKAGLRAGGAVRTGEIRGEE